MWIGETNPPSPDVSDATKPLMPRPSNNQAQVPRTEPAGTAKPASTTVTFDEPYDSRRATGWVGLYNQGATCYMNTLLQLFFHIPYFREAVYMMATDSDTVSQIPKALQNLFFQLQEKRTAVSTKCLTDAFGWDREVFVQHDIQELAALLRDNLENKMKGTPAEGAINRMFVGIGENVVSTLDGTYTSRRKEIFYDIHLPVTGHRHIYSSIKSLVAKDKLTGDNKYKVEEEGKPAVYKDAETGYRFLKFPPIILFHLKRFEMDMTSPTLDMKKINSELEFTTSLDLSEFECCELLDPNDVQPLRPLHSNDGQPSVEPKESEPKDPPVYDLYGIIIHRGGVRSGHYYACIRDYDPVTGVWSPWNQFEDEDVRVVSEQTAVERNFGGYTYSYLSGRETTIPATHSAYILAYMRRAELPRLVYSIQTDVIPRYVKDEFERLLREEERIQREEKEKAQMVTFQIFTDSDICQHVQRDVFDLVPARNGYSSEVTLFKFDYLKSLYEACVRACGGRASTSVSVRLWRWRWYLPTQAAGYRPDEPLPPIETAATVTIDEALRKFHVHDEQKAWSESIYVETPREIVPPMVTNIIPLAVDTVVMSTTSIHAEEDFDPREALMKGQGLRFDASDARPKLTVTFNRPFSAYLLVFRCVQSKSIVPSDVTFTFAFYSSVDDEEPFYVQDETHSLSNPQSPLSVLWVPLGHENPKIQKIRIARTKLSYHATAAMNILKLAVHVPPSEIPEFQHVNPGRPVVPRIDDQHLLLMVKAFNYRSGTISFVGPIVVLKADPLQNFHRTLCHMLHLPQDTSLTIFHETKPDRVDMIPSYRAPCTGEGNLWMGSIITVQEDVQKVPLAYRFVRADHAYDFFEQQRCVAVHRYRASDEPVISIPMQLNWKHDRIAEAIGDHLGLDPAFLRIYGSCSFAHPAPRAEAERSDSGRTLSQILTLRGYLAMDLFYEPLSVQLQVVEQQLQLHVTVCDSMGKALAPEVSFDLPSGSSATTIVVHTLQQANLTSLIEKHDGHFVFLEIADHLIMHYLEADLNRDPAASKKVNRVHQAGREYEVRPFVPPPPDHTLYPCCHADNTVSHSPLFGVPFLLALPNTFMVEDVLQALLDHTSVPIDEVIDPYRLGCMMYTSQLLNFPDWKATELYRYFLYTPHNGPHPRHLVLNHKMPREKPGSRYVAMNEPQLILEKKKDPKTSTGNSPGATATVSNPV